MARAKSRYYECLDRRPRWRGLPDLQFAQANELFLIAIERFGDAWEGGCFCTLLRGSLRWDDRMYSGNGDKHRGGGLCSPQYLFDHSTFFQRKHEPVNAVVGQPYDYTAEQDFEVRKFCQDHRLHLQVENGWHFPGQTKALIFTRRH